MTKTCVYSPFYIFIQTANRRRLIESNLWLFCKNTIAILTISSLTITVIINICLRINGYPNFLSTFDCLSYLLVFTISFVISLLASFLALRRIKDRDVKKELEGEE